MGLESISAAKPPAEPQGLQYARDTTLVVQRLHDHGIALQGCFVFGLDEDEPDVFFKTAEFAVQAHIDLPRFAVVTPFPNTPALPAALAEGRILTRDWELYDAQHVVFRPARMTVANSCKPAPRPPGNTPTASARSCGVSVIPLPRGRSGSAPISATGFTPTT
jgi:hypothetical protein